MPGPQVDFVPLAIGGGSNVIDQATYAAAPTTATGYIAGLAKSNYFNKTWRQSSFVAAGVANFMAAMTGLDILDDGNLAGFITNLTSAIAIQAGNTCGNEFVSNGNPNGQIAGRAGSLGPPIIPPDQCYDIANGIQYYCAAGGNAATAVWVRGTGVAAVFAGTTTTGTANAQVLNPLTPGGFALANGVTVIGTAGFTNTGAATLNAGGSGAIATRKNSNAGLVPLAANDIIATDLYQFTYNGAFWVLGEQSLGTLAFLGAGAGTQLDGMGGLRTNETVGAHSTSAIVAADHKTFKTNAAADVQTWPQVATLWSGFRYRGYAIGSTVTITPNAADSVNGLAAGTSLLVGEGFFYDVTTDGANPGNILVEVKAAVAQTLWVREEQSAGVGPGNAEVLNAWTQRVLNQVKLNTIPGASVGSNQFTLPAGNYKLRAAGPFSGPDGTQIKLRNVTDGADTFIGQSVAVDAGSGVAALLECEFTITATKTFEIDQYLYVSLGNAYFGTPANTGAIEVYTSVFIEKVA